MSTRDVSPVIATQTPTRGTPAGSDTERVEQLAATFTNLVQQATVTALGDRAALLTQHEKQIAAETPERNRQAQYGGGAG